MSDGDLVAFLKARLDEDEAWFRDPRSPVGEDLRQRLLQTIAATRAIIAQHDSVNWEPGDPVLDCQWEHWPCPTLRALAVVYSDHPGYRPEWKP